MPSLRAPWPLALACLALAPPAFADVIETHGRISEVTVYQGQALVTRDVPIEAAAGLHEVVVTGLPEQVVPDSLYAETGEGVSVRSVRYRLRPVEQDTREEVRVLDERMLAINDQIDQRERQRQVLAQRRNYLAQLESFVAPTANTELTQGVLNADTLKSLSEFLFAQHEAIVTAELEADRATRDLRTQLERLARERGLLAGAQARDLHEAVVYVELRGDSGQVRLRYLVNQATWRPSYNVRAALAEGRVAVEYNASIQQLSGEDWTDVAMTLSTASPSLVARAPVLEPLTISLGPATVEVAQLNADIEADDYRTARRQLSERREQVARDRASLGREFAAAEPAPSQPLEGLADQAYSFNAPAMAKKADSMLNIVAGELQVLELIAGQRTGADAEAAADATEGLSVSYVLAETATLPSRADQQLVRIAAASYSADIYRLAAPVLTSFVYREAKLTNAGPHVLLAGPVTTYVDEQFVGRGDLPTVAVGQRFTLGLGIDSSLRATRTLLSRDDSIQGGNRVTELVYELGIENFGADPASLRLVDRMPTAKESEVKLTLVSDGHDLSDDPEYQQADRKRGMLRWDVTAPVERGDAKPFRLEYRLRLEYDKQLAIGGLPLRH